MFDLLTWDNNNNRQWHGHAMVCIAAPAEELQEACAHGIYVFWLDICTLACKHASATC